MRDLNLTTPREGERLKASYLRDLQRLAEHNHVPVEGLVDRGNFVPLPFSASNEIVPCRITEALVSGGSAAAVLLTGASRSIDGTVITVKDIPTMITSGYQIPDETICRVVYDSVVGSYVLAIPAVCEEEQPE